MKDIKKTSFFMLVAVILALAGGCKDDDSGTTPNVFEPGEDAKLFSLKIAQFPVTLADPGASASGAKEGSVTLKGPWADLTVPNPQFSIINSANSTVEYASGATPGDFGIKKPDSLAHNAILLIKVTSMDKSNVSVYKVKVSVENSTEGYGVKDSAWASDPYNVQYRVFPNAPEYGILTYPWGSGNNNYFDQNAPVTYWNGKGHNHKYPDVFHFANGNKVETPADWENRRTEIFNILQYYMHGRMPSIDTDEINIIWRDRGNTCEISIVHVSSNRTARFEVAHTPPEGATAGARDKILMFGVGFAPNASRHPGWGTATFQTSWGGSESNRGGTCATLYGFGGNAVDTPSVNMQYAWAMSIILSVIEQGGFGGYYNPEKVGIYGFSRYGKASMLIGAFAQSRGGARIGQTFIGSAGSGGPSLDRFIAQAGYKGFDEDPLPVDGVGAMSYNDLTTVIWYQQLLSDTPAAGNNNRGVVRGWTAETPGIPAGAHVYGETVDFIAKPFVKQADDPEGIRDGFGGIQNLTQARGETGGWFSVRFRSLTDLHNGLDLDHDDGQPGRGREGVLCTMPFDAHFISALIAPRIVYYEDGYDTTRNNPEAQWANWLMSDELYQFYAEKLNDPSIIWRNAIKMYHIPHAHQTYQDQDEADLVNAIYGNSQPNAKFRTPPFPVDDPRYRWDFDRMDLGRPGHPTIAERVRAMRESAAPVKAMDTRGLLDTPEGM